MLYAIRRSRGDLQEQQPEGGFRALSGTFSRRRRGIEYIDRLAADRRKIGGAAHEAVGCPGLRSRVPWVPLRWVPPGGSGGGEGGPGQEPEAVGGAYGLEPLCDVLSVPRPLLQ